MAGGIPTSLRNGTTAAARREMRFATGGDFPKSGSIVI